RNPEPGTRNPEPGTRNPQSPPESSGNLLFGTCKKTVARKPKAVHAYDFRPFLSVTFKTLPRGQPAGFSKPATPGSVSERLTGVGFSLATVDDKPGKLTVHQGRSYGTVRSNSLNHTPDVHDAGRRQSPA
ncbi:MAG TPA: hypothetical protein PKZ53_15280, partial [Acidobacteriota bacterium]|nr:hypothetical protein [Acidobacteriota bacterium]